MDRHLGLILAAAGAALYLLLAPMTADVAAAVYRAEIWDQTWNPNWYGGHHTPGYSLIVPALVAVLGAWLTGGLATVAAVFAFDRLVEERWATTLFALLAVANLFAGRIPFAVGMALGLAALALERHEKHRWAIALALLTPLASPVAGAFLALGAVAWKKWWLAAAGLAPAAILAVAFPTGGTFPFDAGSFWPAFAFTIAGLALAPKGVVRVGLIVYAVALVAAFVIPSPMGGNAARLGMLFLGPALVAVAPKRAVWLVVPVLVWAALPAVRDVAAIQGDPSVEAAYWKPVTALDGPVEVVFTRNHWEAAHVARELPIARGWERQLDRERNALFYDGRLTPARYRRWLRDRGVRYVVVPDVELDYSARQEARVARGSLRLLRRSGGHEIYAAQ